MGKAGLSVYRLKGLGSRRAEFELAGHSGFTPLERLSGGDRGYGGLVAGEGTAYTGIWRRRVSVYDLSRPEWPHRAGYCVLSDDQARAFVPQADGRLLVVGNRYLHLFRPPKAD
jgi:hypothetical protein